MEKEIEGFTSSAIFSKRAALTSFSQKSCWKGRLTCAKSQCSPKSMNKMCMPHVGDSRLGTICDLHLVASWPSTVAPYMEIFNDHPIGDYTGPFSIFETPPTLTKDGYFDLPQGPGLGMKIREDLIDKS